MKYKKPRETQFYRLTFLSLLSCVLFLLSISLCGCDNNGTSSKDESQKIIRLDKLDPLPPKKTTSPPDVIRIAVAAVLSPEGTLDSYSPLMSYIEKVLKKPVKLIQRKTYQEINDLLARGSVDVAFVCTGAYIEGLKKDIMSILVVPQINGGTTYQSFIIVNQSSEAQTFEDLRGKTFAFTDPMSNTGYFYPLSLLREKGETPESYFNRTIFTYSHDRSIHAVADGIVDGASVDNLILEHAERRDPKLSGRIRIIWKSQEFGIPPVVIPKQLNLKRKKEFEDLFLNIHAYEQGRQALETVGIEKFVKPDHSLYNF